jgi:hypothetical protein
MQRNNGSQSEPVNLVFNTHVYNHFLYQRRNCYEMLEVERTATPQEIRKKYRNLAIQYHPDHNKEVASGEKFKEITSAYEILSDAQKKEYYDSLLGYALKASSPNTSTPQPKFAANRKVIEGLCNIIMVKTKAEDRSFSARLKFVSATAAEQFKEMWNRDYEKDSLIYLFRALPVYIEVVLGRGFVEKYKLEFNETKSNACEIAIAVMQKHFDIDKFVEVKPDTSQQSKPAPASFTPSTLPNPKTSSSLPSSSSSGNFFSTSSSRLIPGLQKIIKFATPTTSIEGFLELDFGEGEEGKEKAEAFCRAWEKHNHKHFFGFELRSGKCIAAKYTDFYFKNLYSLNDLKQTVAEIMLDKLRLHYEIPNDIIQENKPSVFVPRQT